MKVYVSLRDDGIVEVYRAIRGVVSLKISSEIRYARTNYEAHRVSEV